MDGGFESGTLDGVVDTNAYLVPADSVGGNSSYVLYLPTVDNNNPSEAWQMITGLTRTELYLSYRMKWERQATMPICVCGYLFHAAPKAQKPQLWGAIAVRKR